MAELQSYLSKIGGSPLLAYADRLEGDDLKHTMILLGGPDANSATRRVAKRLTSNLRFGNSEINEVSIRDTSAWPTKIYGPSRLDVDNSGIDYGLILRAPNPFATDKEVVILAGSFGHGTWAATRHVTSNDFLEKSKTLRRAPIECLVETDVELDTPQKIRPLLLRNFDQISQPSSAADIA